ncbi:hypothetical protein ACIGBL_34595 [Streptomyces sp. NPDC085614]|uniref:hypothetical protein n=1 Tax=Streptomyces sp. NPDC085614 TaxID=3365733 RepID=UPI0037CCC5DE
MIPAWRQAECSQSQNADRARPAAADTVKLLAQQPDDGAEQILAARARFSTLPTGMGAGRLRELASETWVKSDK